MFNPTKHHCAPTANNTVGRLSNRAFKTILPRTNNRFAGWAVTGSSQPVPAHIQFWSPTIQYRTKRNGKAHSWRQAQTSCRGCWRNWLWRIADSARNVHAKRHHCSLKLACFSQIHFSKWVQPSSLLTSNKSANLCPASNGFWKSGKCR